MGAGYALGVEPPVISICKPEGQLLILIVVFAHIDVVSVRGNIMEGLAGDLWPLIVWTALFHIAVFHQFLLDLHQIIFSQSDIQGRADGFQMVDFRLCLVGQLG